MVREVLTPRPRYSEKEREIVYGALTLVAKMLVQNGVNVIIDATANRRKYRRAARRRIIHFSEIYLKCPLAVCVERETRRKKRFGAPSRIYAKARSGASKTVPGLGVPYEAPLSPELMLDTSQLRPSQSSEQITDFVIGRYGQAAKARTRKR
jgi:adenylylsulfate kinase